MKNYYFTEYELHSGDTELNLHLTALGFEPLIDDWCGSPITKDMYVYLRTPIIYNSP